MTLTDEPASGTATMDFGPLRIAYDERVLRPRPWTELQARWAADLVEKAPPGPVLELCCGAGQIGLLAVHGSQRRLVAVDASPVACEFTRQNAHDAGLHERVEVRADRLEEALRPEERFPLIIADPPWVPARLTDRFPEDPVAAIDGGEDGLDVARACLAVIAEHLSDGGHALLQLGSGGQARALRSSMPPGLMIVGIRGEGPRGVVVHLVRRAARGRHAVRG